MHFSWNAYRTIHKIIGSAILCAREVLNAPESKILALLGSLWSYVNHPRSTEAEGIAWSVGKPAGQGCMCGWLARHAGRSMNSDRATPFFILNIWILPAVSDRTAGLNLEGPGDRV